MTPGTNSGVVIVAVLIGLAALAVAFRIFYALVTP
jgi:hypothetical protein